MTDTTHIQSPTGARLFSYTHDVESPRAVVQINHGLAEHAARYAPFMAALAAQGIASVAHDHRGHGKTEAPGARLGHFASRHGRRHVIEDTNAVQEWCADRWPGAPLIAFGHSLGGLIALNTAVTSPDRLHALAIWNSNAAPGFMGRIGAALNSVDAAIAGRGSRARVLPALTFAAWDKLFADEGPAFHWLSPDPAQVQAYIDDPLCGFECTTALWADVMAMARVGEDPSSLKRLPPNLPIQLIGATNDPATENGKAIRALEAALAKVGRTRVSSQLYPDVRHETLNGPLAAQATEDFVAWINSTLG